MSTSSCSHFFRFQYFLMIFFLRPACFLSLRTTQHDFWSATQRGADYAEALETCRCTYPGGICIRTGSGTGSVQIPLLFAFGTRNFGYCDRYPPQRGPKTVPNVCLPDDVRSVFATVGRFSQRSHARPLGWFPVCPVTFFAFCR